MKTTLNQIREHSPCHEGWTKLLRTLGKTKADDEPVGIIQILDSNGLGDALWSLRAVKGHDREIRLFAVWCARQVEHLMGDERSKNALDVSERFANGHADRAELDAARAAAWSAARAAEDAARAAAWSAARAAEDAAEDAARAAAWSAARAAEDAAWTAVLTAEDAARAAEDAARAAAGDAAWSAAGAAQSEKLREICNRVDSAQ